MALNMRCSDMLQTQMTRLHKKDYFKDKCGEEPSSLAIKFQKFSFMIMQRKYCLRPGKQAGGDQPLTIHQSGYEEAYSS